MAPCGKVGSNVADHSKLAAHSVGVERVKTGFLTGSVNPHCRNLSDHKVPGHNACCFVTCICRASALQRQEAKRRWMGFSGIVVITDRIFLYFAHSHSVIFR